MLRQGTLDVAGIKGLCFSLHALLKDLDQIRLQPQDHAFFLPRQGCYPRSFPY
jgi:hypothetical protein